MGKAMTKGALLKAIATEHDLKTKACSNVLNSLVTVATNEVKKTGIFTIPGICRIKTRVKPASKDSGESFRGCRTQETDLDTVSSRCLVTLLSISQRLARRGNPTARA